MKNETSLTELTCEEFTSRLAAKVSVPGGGGAAALTGALSSALCSMTANFTAGKKKYAQYEDDIQRIISETDAVRIRLLNLVDEDASAFYPLSESYSIPKDEPGRQEKIEEASKAAALPPLKMMRETAHIIDLLDETLQKGSVMMISDVGCGALLAKAALQAASLNVFINTKTLTDREFADHINREADELLQKYCSRADRISQKVFESMEI